MIMSKTAKIEQVYKLSASVKKKLTGEQQEFLKKNKYQGTSICICLNATKQDEQMMDSISDVMDIRFVILCEPDEPEL